MFKVRIPAVPVVATLFLAVALLAGCAPLGLGKVVTREEAITGFDRVEVNNAFKVDITQGDTFSVVVRFDSSFERRLEVVMEGNTLRIGLKDEGGDESKWRIQAGTREAEITMPALTGLSLSGASDGTITGFKSAQALDVGLDGASSLQGDVKAGDARFEAQGGSETTLSGSGQNLTVVADGGSTVDLSKFSTVDADVNAGGDSEVTVNASGTLDAVADGKSTVYYLGSPTLGTIEESGSSEVRQK
ncbi:head GIN domain-containing protein [Chloroflexota bacterium]